MDFSYTRISRSVAGALALLIAGLVLSACGESLSEAEIWASATARAYERQTLEAQRESIGTRPAVVRTPTPIPSPNLEATAVAQIRELLTVTAWSWTLTPTPTETVTPDLNATAQALIFEAWTVTAESWTATPTPDLDATVQALAAAVQSGSSTPDFEATADALLALRLTETAESWTDTPTPDLDATIDAMVLAALTATAAGWTETPLPTATATPAAITDTPTPDYDATVQALVAAALSGSTPPVFISPPSAAELAEDALAQGPEDAPVVLVVVYDPQCANCVQFHTQILPDLLATYADSVRVAYRLVPVFGQDSTRASQAALCAADQGQFWEMMDALAATREAGVPEPFSRANLIGLASDLDLGLANFVACLSDSARRDALGSAAQEMAGFGIAEVPTYLINDNSLTGAATLTDFEVVINALLALAAPAS